MGQRETIPEAGIDPAALVSLIPALFGNKTNQSQTQTQTQKASVDPDILANVKNMIAQLTGEASNPHNDLIDSILQKSAVNFAPTRALENSSGGYNSTTLKLLQDNARGEATSQAVQAVLTAQRQAADTAARLSEGALNATRSVSTSTTTNGTTAQKGSIVPLATTVAAGALLRKLTGGKNSVTLKDVQNFGEPVLNKFGKFSPRQEEYAAGSDAQFEPNGGSLGTSSGGAGTSSGAFSFGDSGGGSAYSADALAGAPNSSFLTPDDISASIEMATRGAASNAALLHTGTSASVADASTEAAMAQPQQAQVAQPQAQMATQIEQPAYANAPEVRPGPAEEQITGKPLRDPTNDPIVKSGPSNYDNIISGASLAAPTDASNGFLNTLRPAPNMSIVPGTEPVSMFPHAEPNMSVAPASFLQGGESPIGSTAIEDMVVPGIGGAAESQVPVTVGGDFGGASAADNLANTTPSDYGDFGGASLADDAGNAANLGVSGTGQIPILGPALQIAQGEPAAAGANVGITYGLTSIGVPFPVAAFVGQNLATPVNDVADDLIRGIGGAGKATGDLFTDIAKNTENFLSDSFDSLFGHGSSFGSGVSHAFDSVGSVFSDAGSSVSHAASDAWDDISSAFGF